MSRHQGANYRILTGTLWGGAVQMWIVAFRSLCRNPGFSAIATLLLALGIAANAAIFTLIDKILLTPLPVARPDQLIDLDR